MGESSYTSVTWRVDTINQENKYGTLVEKLIQFELNDYPKFQEHLKKLHLTEFHQAQTQQQVKNKEKSNEVVQAKPHIQSISPIQSIPSKSWLVGLLGFMAYQPL